MHLKKGTLLKHGDYRIESVLAQGGFGITYLAMQTGLNRKVAIKEFFMYDFCERDPETSHVSLGTSGSRETVERFKAKFIKEAQTIAGLNNPHIIRIHDVFEENGTAYYVMEYHEGGTLADLVKDGGGLSERQAVHYIRQIADALQYIHNRNMNHLDVKPGNVLLDDDGNAVLIDFGLAKRYDAEGNQTSTTPVGISHGYAPLEQYQQGGVSTFSPATDIYSLGATLYKLITGNTPPNATVVNEDGLPEIPSSVSPSVASAIERSMHPVRKNRLQSAAEFLALLDAPAPEISRQEKTEMEHNQNEETELEDIDAVKHENKGDDGEFVSMFAAEEKRSPIAKRVYLICVILFLIMGIAAALFVNGGDNSPAPVVEEDNTAQAEADRLVEQQAESLRIAEERRLAEDAELARLEEQRRAEEEAECKRQEENQRQTASFSTDSRGNKTFTVNGVSFKMVAVNGGTFRMGATKVMDSDAYDDEGPVHSVTLSDYYIGETEVTQDLWQAVMGSNPSRFKGNLQRPVEQVSWNECRTFISKLNALTGGNFRLPTEAEWEYAARGGQKSLGYKYSGSDNIGEVAWYGEDFSTDSTHPVKTKSPNELGIYDMSGNVWEWCEDWYGDYSSAAQTNPDGPNSGQDRVYRGGGWNEIARDCRSSYRGGPLGLELKSRGLRLALSL